MDKISHGQTDIVSGYNDGNDVSTGQTDIKHETLLRIKERPVVNLDDYREGKELIDTEKLYQGSNETFPLLSNAFVLLNDALGFIEDARACLKEDDLYGSDNAILHVTAVLEELFCCRSIGDNFGTLVSAIFHSFANRDQRELFSLPQLNKIHNTLRVLRSEPFLDLDLTVEVVMALEDNGLNVNPAYLETMMSIINE